jgi:hypothetical protein
LQYTADPRVAPSLSLLAHTYTLRQLHNANINFFSETLDNNDDEMKVMDLLIHVLTYLEKVNAISYWSKGGCINKKANAEEEDEEEDKEKYHRQKDFKGRGKGAYIYICIHTYIHTYIHMYIIEYFLTNVH